MIHESGSINLADRKRLQRIIRSKRDFKEQNEDTDVILDTSWLGYLAYLEESQAR